MSHKGCGGAQALRGQSAKSKDKSSTRGYRNTRHNFGLGNGFLEAAKAQLSPCRAGQQQRLSRGTGAPGAPLAAAQGGGPLPPSPRAPVCTRWQCHGWGCHTVPAAASPRAAKPTFPLTFSMLARCIGMVFIEVSAKAIQTLPKSRLGKNTASWPKLYIFPALSERLKS